MWAAVKMKLPIILAVISLAVFTVSGPVVFDKVIVNKDFFRREFIVYTADHDIVNLFVPLNLLNEDKNKDSSETNPFLFFALADIDKNGHKTYKGLYKFHNKVATKLLDNGRDATADNTDTKLAYFGASDGIYQYDGVKDETTKYGSITDSIIQIVKLNGVDEFYILTENHNVFKITDKGTKNTEIDVVKGAFEIVADNSGNIYFLNMDKKPFVLNGDKAREIYGLPEKPTLGKLLRPPHVLKSSVIYIANKKVFQISSNYKNDLPRYSVEVKPSAYAMDATTLQYYAYDKNIYEFNTTNLEKMPELVPCIVYSMSNVTNARC